MQNQYPPQGSQYSGQYPSDGSQPYGNPYNPSGQQYGVPPQYQQGTGAFQNVAQPGMAGGFEVQQYQVSPTQQFGPAFETEAENPYAYEANAAVYHEVAKSKKRMSKGKKAALIICIALAVVLIGAGTAFALYLNHINEGLTHGGKSNEELENINKALETDASQGETDVFYMLLLGSDTRESSVSGFGRSDSNIVARVDPENAQVTLLSIPRDTKIQIDGYGTQKFNAAFAFNGVAGAIEATEELLDIEISHYAEVSFRDLAGLVDAVGGITVENESRIDNHKCDDGDGNHYIIEKGTVTLNGGEALTFARNRDYPDGDFRRQMHQRMVVEAIAEQVLDAPLTSIPGIIEAALNCVTTDLTVTEIVGLAQQFARADEVTIYSCMVPSFSKTINGISFVIVDEAQTEKMLEVFKEGGDPGDYKATMTADDYVDESEDVSNVLIYEDDDEVTSGSARPYTPTYSESYRNPGNSSGDGNSSNSSSGGGPGAYQPDTGGQNQGTVPEPSAPTDPGSIEPSEPDNSSGDDSGDSQADGA